MIIVSFSYHFIPSLPFLTLYSKEEFPTSTWIAYAMGGSSLASWLVGGCSHTHNVEKRCPFQLRLVCGLMGNFESSSSQLRKTTLETSRFIQDLTMWGGMSLAEERRDFQDIKLCTQSHQEQSQTIVRVGTVEFKKESQGSSSLWPYRKNEK